MDIPSRDEMEKIDWIEKAGLENLRAHIQCIDHLSKECNTTLTILIGGAGAALAYGMKSIDASASSPASYACLFLSLYLFILCGLTVWMCIQVRDAEMATNEPANLNQPGFHLLELRKAELKNIQLRIKSAVARNNETAKWLNRIRMAAIVGAPLIAVIFFLAARSLLFVAGPAAG